MTPSKAPAWDGLVRVLHWTLAALVAIDLVRDGGDRLHRLIGYGAVAVVGARLAWAAVVRGPAGFASLRPSIAQSWAYLKLLLRGRPPRPPGHNPLGIWMIWTIWILVLLLGVTGFMSRLDVFWGDETVQGAHSLLADLLLAAVACHLMGIGVMSWLWRENLPAAMVTGSRRADPQDRLFSSLIPALAWFLLKDLYGEVPVTFFWVGVHAYRSESHPGISPDPSDDTAASAGDQAAAVLAS